MSGNVSEYCYDRGAELPGFFRFNYRGLEEDYDFSAQFRLLRGGNIHSTGEEVTIGAIDSISVTNKGLNVGFRVAQSTGWHPLFFVPPVVLLLLLAGLIALVAAVVSRLVRRTPVPPPAEA